MTDADPTAGPLAWVNLTATPLASVTATASTSDLTAFGAMVGNARIIGLGEDTHGTHEFFTTKDRLFRYLVEHAGVTAFAIEATMPEAFDLDTYVRTGKGDPAILLSHLYFWTWNTQEVTDLIAWLRVWNQAHPARQVGFYGFDMQYPGIAIDSVTAYVARVAPGLSAAIAQDYACLAPYRNDNLGISGKAYSTGGAAVWEPCTPAVADAYARLNTQSAALVAASSQSQFDFTLRMARVVTQWETYARTSTLARDAAMAENVQWLLDREGVGGKLFLWAHNYHISRVQGSMGNALASFYGAAYLPVGFAFGSGGFNAVEILSTGTVAGLKPLAAGPPLSGSYEEVFQHATATNFYLDLRAQRPLDVALWLRGPQYLRSIGAAYSPTQPANFFSQAQLPDQFDVLIFIGTTTASTLLPFKF